MNRSEAEALLRTAVGNPDAHFRAGQWEAIDAIANRRRKMLVVQRTGWGKSLVYFIGTRILRSRGAGPTIIVSPLLALMRNQIDAAGRLNITAESINSTNQDDWHAVQTRILDDQVDAVLISPERLANDYFREQVLQPVAERVGLLVVDEAHCISDWGHDFRPDYRRLVNILQHMPPNMPLLGTTATANDRVISDIQTQLGGIEIQRGPLVRESLRLQTLTLPDQVSRLAWLAQTIPTLPGTGIVYVLTTRDAEQVAEWLNEHDIAARAYYGDVQHGGFSNNAYRSHLESLLLNNKIKVLVATTALGMVSTNRIWVLSFITKRPVRLWVITSKSAAPVAPSTRRSASCCAGMKTRTFMITFAAARSRMRPMCSAFSRCWSRLMGCPYRNSKPS